jgi:hypothetical protein
MGVAIICLLIRWHQNWHIYFEMGGRIQNTIKVIQGLLRTDTCATNESRFWQLVSRFTWELPNTITGFIAATGTTLFVKTDVGFFHGSTFVKVRSMRSDDDRYHAATLGSFILGSAYSDPLLVHEYGHCLQSRRFGPGYLPLIALPSLLSIIFSSKKHGNRWFERDADMRANLHMSGRNAC